MEKQKGGLFVFYLPENEKGQGLVEFALILVLVAIIVVAVLALLGPQISTFLSKFTGR